MRFLNSLLALPITGAWALAPRPTKGTPQKSDVVPNTFILEVAKSELTAVTATVIARGGKILKTFKSDVFSGLSIESTIDNVDSLQGLTKVANAWPQNIIQLAPIQPAQSFSDDAAATNWSLHKYTGVQEAHEAGYYGKGAVVAIVDTGTLYTHPALGGGFGPGYKVAGGYDFVGDGDWPAAPKEPDSDPYDIIGHGTHVAGIVGGKSEWYTGVAPEATILSYKVFTPSGNTDDATLIEAFLAAYDAGADVITASIGGPSGWTSDPWAVVASRLVDLGVIVTISAGNSGDDGPFYASSGSSGKNVLAVASIDAQEKLAVPFTAAFVLDGAVNFTTVGYIPGYYYFELQGLPIIPVSYDTEDPAQACSALPAGTPDLTGAIALIRRGTCQFALKQQYAAELGAKYVLFYNNLDKGITQPSSSFSPDLGMIEASAGEAIVATWKAGGSVTGTFKIEEDWRVGTFNEVGGIPSEFTSWGGTFDLEIKPDIAAPGGSIYAPYLDNTYAVLSGTSMACPYVAGVAALYVGKYGGRAKNGPGFAKTVVDKIIASGGAVQWQTLAPNVGTTPVDYGYYAPPIQVGTGLINAWKVLSYDTSLDFEKFALNDTRHFNRYHDVYITNNGAKPVTYKFTLQPAGGINLISQSPWLAYLPELEPLTLVPNVSFPSGTFTVKAGETKKAQFNFKPFQGVDPANLPVYSGKILISGSNGEELSVPYTGAAFDLHEATRQHLFVAETPRQMSGPAYEDIDTYHTYTFNATTQSFPKVWFELYWGSPEIRFDIFEAGWKESKWSYPPVVGENGYIGSATTWKDAAYYYDFYPEFMSRDDLNKFPLYNVFRTSAWTYYTHAAWWMGKLADDTYIEPGKYTIRFAALSPSSDPNHADNWHVWKTPQIEVLPLEI